MTRHEHDTKGNAMTLQWNPDERFNLRDNAMRAAVAYLDARTTYCLTNDVSDCSTVDFFSDDREYDFSPDVDDNNAFDRNVYRAALTRDCPAIPPELHEPLIDVLLTNVVHPAHYDPYADVMRPAMYHYSDSVVDEMTRVMDHAYFARAARDMIAAKIDSDARDLVPAYTSPRDVLAVMTNLITIIVAYVPHPDNRNMYLHPNNTYHNLTIDATECFNNPDLFNAFRDLIPWIDDEPDTYEPPANRSDF